MEILALGDSHTEFLKRGHHRMAKLDGLARVNASLKVIPVSRASARGVSRDRPQSLAMTKLRRIGQRGVSYDALCACFGQVDAEVGHYYRKYVAGSDRSFEDDITETYASYVRETIELAGGKPVVFKGINPTALRFRSSLRTYVTRWILRAIQSEEKRKEVTRAIASEVKPDEHIARNNLAASILKREVQKAGAPYFDVRDSTEQVGQPGAANVILMQPGGRDVHLADSFGLRLLHRRRLAETLLNMDR